MIDAIVWFVKLDEIFSDRENIIAKKDSCNLLFTILSYEQFYKDQLLVGRKSLERGSSVDLE